jgi:hypothetical protein
MKKTEILLFILGLLLSACTKNTERSYNLRFYGDAYQDIGNSVLITSDGYVIAGQLTDIKRKNGNIIESSDRNMGIVKVNWNGDVIWKVTTGGKFEDSASKIYQLADGSFICAGTFTDTTAALPGKKEIYVVKLSPAGSVVWEKTYGGAGNQTGADITKTPEGFMILGSTDVSRGSGSDSLGNKEGFSDFYFLRIAEDGTMIDSKPWGFPENDIPRVIKPSGDGNFYALGTTDLINSKDNKLKTNILIVKINSVCDILQYNLIGGPEDETASDMEMLTDGILVAGTVGKDGGNQHIYVSKLKKYIFAAPYYTKSISIADPNNPALASCGVSAISRYGTGSFVLAGYTGTVSAARMMVFEMDGDGNQVSGHQFLNGSTSTEVANDVIAGDDGFIITVGRNTYDVNSMIAFLKFKF